MEEKTAVEVLNLNLSPREREVLERIAHGEPNKCIAADLRVSIRTVESHRYHMVRKMGAQNTPHAVFLATRLGWLK